jgi:hypothetical protein
MPARENRAGNRMAQGLERDPAEFVVSEMRQGE